MYTTWREYKNHSGSTKTEGWSELSFHPWEDAGNSSTVGEENSKISSLRYWRKVLMDCLLVYCAMKIHLLTDLTWGLQGTDLTKHFGELLKWLLALWPLAWRLSHPVCSITRAHCHASWLNRESCLTLLVGCVHTILMYQMAGLKSVSTGAFGLDFSLFISLSILLRCSYLRKIPPGFPIRVQSKPVERSVSVSASSVSWCQGCIPEVHSCFLCFIFCQIPISAKLCSSLPFQLRLQEQLQLVPSCLRVEFTYTRCQEHFELARWT